MTFDNHKNRFGRILAAISLVVFGVQLHAAAAANSGGLAAAAIFSDHMVLQREVKVPVWGTADAGDAVTVSFQGQTKTAIAGADGKWIVRLDQMPAESTPRTMTVKTATQTATFSDVLVGDVWLGSGQSNMEFGWTFSDEFKARRAAREKSPEKAKDPNYMGGCIDEVTLKVLRRAVTNPMIRISAKTRDHLNTPGTGWALVDEQNVKTMPALAGCIAVYLQEEIKVPVGIIVRAVSSTHTVRWVTRDGFLKNPIVMKQIEAVTAAGSPSPTLTGTSADAGFGNLYAEYIEPVVPYALRGFLWDQGEQGIGYRGVDWTAAMHALVTSWRAAWGQGDLLWSATDHYPDDLETKLAEAGLEKFRIAKTDGLSGALHPLNKWQYAQRHLENIFPLAYGRPAPPWPDRVRKTPARNSQTATPRDGVMVWLPEDPPGDVPACSGSHSSRRQTSTSLPRVPCNLGGRCCSLPGALGARAGMNKHTEAHETT